MKNKNQNVVICPPCGENVALATKRGANKENLFLPLLPRLTAVLPPQGREITTHGFTACSVTPQNTYRLGVSPTGAASKLWNTCHKAGNLSGLYPTYKGCRAFTLIELLVVVLIIGILAAVAVPQYQKAVEKSRATEALVIIKALAEAEQLFYLANGDYSYDLTLLDLDVPGVSTTLGVGKAIETNYFICRASAQTTSALWKDALAVCERKGPNSVYTLVHTKDGSDYCVYYSDFGQQICKSFGKEKAPEVRENTYRI